MEIQDTMGKREIFCRFIRKNGKIIYPKNAKFFHFWVDDVKANHQNAVQMNMFDMKNK